MGVLLLNSETAVELDAGVRDAAVRLIWKNRTVTPFGGSSVMLRLTGAELLGLLFSELFGAGAELQPVMNMNNRIITSETERRNRAIASLLEPESLLGKCQRFRAMQAHRYTKNLTMPRNSRTIVELLQRRARHDLKEQ